MQLCDHAAKLRKALLSACEEHGMPNSFSFGELNLGYGAPRPPVAGRAIQFVTSLADGWFVWAKGGRVYVAKDMPCRCQQRCATPGVGCSACGGTGRVEATP